jgi:hypothetical protein
MVVSVLEHMHGRKVIGKMERGKGHCTGIEPVSGICEMVVLLYDHMADHITQGRTRQDTAHGSQSSLGLRWKFWRESWK